MVKSVLLWALVIGEAIAIGLVSEPLGGMLFFAVVIFGLIVMELVSRERGQ